MSQTFSLLCKPDTWASSWSPSSPPPLQSVTSLSISSISSTSAPKPSPVSSEAQPPVTHYSTPTRLSPNHDILSGPHSDLHSFPFVSFSCIYLLFQLFLFKCSSVLFVLLLVCLLGLCFDFYFFVFDWKLGGYDLEGVGRGERIRSKYIIWNK